MTTGFFQRSSFRLSIKSDKTKIVKSFLVDIHAFAKNYSVQEDDNICHTIETKMCLFNGWWYRLDVSLDSIAEVKSLAINGRNLIHITTISPQLLKNLILMTNDVQGNLMTRHMMTNDEHL